MATICPNRPPSLDPDWNILEYSLILGPHQTKICDPNQAANKGMLMAHNVSQKLYAKSTPNKQYLEGMGIFHPNTFGRPTSILASAVALPLVYIRVRIFVYPCKNCI